MRAHHAGMRRGREFKGGLQVAHRLSYELTGELSARLSRTPRNQSDRQKLIFLIPVPAICSVFSRL
jgi:hypothetical protein